ncbi:hypothetical protein LEMLEM_LOCUS13031, partial [Lemmus lemmus]
ARRPSTRLSAQDTPVSALGRRAVPGRRLAAATNPRAILILLCNPTPASCRATPLGPQPQPGPQGRIKIS